MINQKTNPNIEERKKLIEFEKVFKINYPRFKSFATHLLGDESEAEDVVQEVFVQTWYNIDNITEEVKSAYLFTSVRNRCLNKIKHDIVKRKYEQNMLYFDSEELYHIDFMGENEFISVQKELTSEIDKLMEIMPPKCAQVFRMKWIEGKKHREIADALQISMTMVDKHIARGLDIAKKNLKVELFAMILLIHCV